MENNVGLVEENSTDCLSLSTIGPSETSSHPIITLPKFQVLAVQLKLLETRSGAMVISILSLNVNLIAM